MTDVHEPQNGGAGTATAERPVPEDASAKRLVRRTDQKMVAGVAAGVADYTGLDVALVRVGFVLLAIFSGVGLIAYLAGWILLPPSDDPDAPPAIHASGAAAWIGISLIALAASLLVHEVGLVQEDIFLPLLLIGIGVALWSTSSSRRTQTASPDGPPPGPPAGGPPSPGQSDPDAGATDIEDALVGVVPAAGAGHSTGAPQTSALPPSGSRAGGGATFPVAAPAATHPGPRPHRERSILGRLTSGALVISLGVGLLLDNLHVVEFSFRAALVMMLVVIGGGLLVGAWWGRARWLIVPGALVATALLLSNFATANLDPVFGPRHIGYRVGEQTWRPTSVSELRSSYRMLGGRMVVDLSDLDRVPVGTQTEVRLGFGELVLRLPPDIPVDVTTSAEAGEIHLFGQGSEGIEVRRRHRDPPTGVSDPDAPRPGRLVVDAQVGIGEIHVERGAR